MVRNGGAPVSCEIPSGAPVYDLSCDGLEEYTPLRDVGAVYRARLLALRTRGSAAQRLAGDLLLEHGEAARRVLWRRSPLTVTEHRADALLDLAGLVAEVQVRLV